MDSVEFERGEAPSMYNPIFLRKVRASRKAQMESERRARRRFEVDRAVKAGAIPVNCRPDFKRIVTRICWALEVDPVELFSRKRSDYLVFARHAVMYWTCRLSRRSYPQIGYLMGRDHTSIIHGKDAYVQKRAAMGRTLRPAR